MNPAWAKAPRHFRKRTMEPVLAHSNAKILTQYEQQPIQKALPPCQQWLADRTATSLGLLDEKMHEALRGRTPGNV